MKSGAGSLRRIAWRIGRIVVLFYVVVVVMLLFLENRLIFHPRREPLTNWQPPVTTGQSVEFVADDGTKLSGWYLPHPRPRATILFHCGNGGNKSYWSDTFAKLNYDYRCTVFGYDYRGYGQSEGSPSGTGILADARAARRKLVELSGVPENQVVLMGRSLGGGVACDLASDGCRALVLESTFTSLPDVGARIYPFLPVRTVMRTRLNSLERMRDYRGPLFVSHGDRDELIPLDFGRKLFEAAAGERKEFFVVPRGGHNDPQPEAYYAALAKFLDPLDVADSAAAK
jgi:fermentation-respiration switch protein FrsA (DUF1100 family)